MAIVNRVVEAVQGAVEKAAEAVGLSGQGGGGEQEAVGGRARLRIVRGVVASDKGDKTIKVVVNYQTRHPKYGKFLKRRTTLHAHDEKNDAKEGDKAEI